MAVMSESFLFQAHGVFGIVAAVCAAAAALLPKGGLWHRRAGQAFLVALTIFFVAGASVAVGRANIFMLTVGVLAYYLALSGVRAHTRARTARGAYAAWTRIGPIDRGSAQVMVLVGAAAAAWGVFAWPREPAAPALVVLGLGGAVLALGDLRRLRRPGGARSDRIRGHGRRMVAAVAVMAVGFGTVVIPHGSFSLRAASLAAVAAACIFLADRYARRWAARHRAEQQQKQQHEGDDGGPPTTRGFAPTTGGAHR
ncbi:MAG: hypothetical protein VX183_01290 [Pseudomonadota bacterium]|nr:hypothetical protein [Pseudomonadota bacterium]